MCKDFTIISHLVLLTSIARGNGDTRKRTATIITVEITSHQLDFAGSHAELVMAVDITERKLAEKALVESEDRYRDLVDNSHELMCTHDLEGRIISVNPWAARVLGYKQEALIGLANP